MFGGRGFIETTQPANIIGVIDRELLVRVLESYCYPLEAGLTVYYPMRLPASRGELLRIESEQVRKRFFFEVCGRYRGYGIKCETACRECDERIVLKYYGGEWRGPKLYHCHLRLWDMTYPLYVGGNLLGVLFGGQIIVGNTVSDWRKAVSFRQGCMK